LLKTIPADASGVAEVFRTLPDRNQFVRVFFQAAEFERVTQWIMNDIPAK